jgi:hypothetical protein
LLIPYIDLGSWIISHQDDGQAGWIRGQMCETGDFLLDLGTNPFGNWPAQ